MERIYDVVCRLENIVHDTPSLDDKVKSCINDAIKLLWDINEMEHDKMERRSDGDWGGC